MKTMEIYFQINLFKVNMILSFSLPLRIFNLITFPGRDRSTLLNSFTVSALP
jgi:hypothetical protein